MTSIIKFQALSGAYDESPPCYLLQVDECKILLDCGWDEKFNFEVIKELKKHVNHLDAVLLSHPDVQHLGALPYLVGKCGLSCPIYATIPVYKMGQMFMYDWYQSRHNMEQFDLFTLDDVDAAFDKMTQLKYNQSVPLKGRAFGLTITPLSAGHMIGGTIWKISESAEEEIVYAVAYNHKKERHLNGCELEKIQRPSLLITDSFNATYQQTRRRVRDEQLMTNILQTLRSNGNVLVAVDTAGRVLELAHMLEQLWRNKESGLSAYSIAFLSNVSYNTIEFAKSQIEWMSEKLMRTFEGARNNPFQLKHMHLCHSLHELSRVSSPKLVLASSPDLESGFARDLFVQWCGNPSNSIILTQRTSPGTLARDLIDNGGDRDITLEVKKRIRLEGGELQEYLQAQKDHKEEPEEVNTSDSDDEVQMVKITKGRHDFVVRDLKPSHSFFKGASRARKQNAMFPYTETKVKYDDYGEVINPDEFRLELPGEKPTVRHIEAVYHDEVKELEQPTKCVTSMRTVEVRAQITFIDFEGRSDGESTQKIVAQIRPRRLIVVGGVEAATQALVTAAESSTDAKIFSPRKCEPIDVTTELHIYQIRLTDRLLSSLLFQPGKDAEVAWLDAKVLGKTRSADANAGNRDGSNDDIDDENAVTEEEQILSLDLMELQEVPGHETSYLNELKLSDFKQVLHKNGIPCEFIGGVLWCCNGTVAVRRHEAGRVFLEGCLSEDYFKVKDLLYQQYAIV